MAGGRRGRSGGAHPTFAGSPSGSPPRLFRLSPWPRAGRDEEQRRRGTVGHRRPAYFGSAAAAGSPRGPGGRRPVFRGRASGRAGIGAGVFPSRFPGGGRGGNGGYGAPPALPGGDALHAAGPVPPRGGGNGWRRG